MKDQFNKIPSRAEAELLSTPELARWSSSSKNLRTLFKPILDERKVLHHVVRGDHNAVRALLTQDIDLLFKKSRVTDLSGRTFESISPFEYALWALDKPMWDTMLSCLPQNKKANEVIAHLLSQYKTLQIKEHTAEEKVETLQIKGVTYSLQGKKITEPHYDFAIIGALQKQVNAQNAPGHKDWDAIDKQWHERVDGGRRLLPMHVVYEYCSNESFSQVPQFNARQLQSWFGVHSQLGGRFTRGVRRLLWGREGGAAHVVPRRDLDAMMTLCKTRMQDFSVLEARLESLQVVEVQPRPGI